MEAETKRKYLSISAISMLGTCETKFYDTMFRVSAPSAAMKAGTAAHKAIEAKSPKMTKEQIMSELRAGHHLDAREVMLFDASNRICGRVDHLQATGFMQDGRNTSLIIDDKYPQSPDRIFGMTLKYKIQLAGYAVAISNSADYGSICRVIGTQLRYRETGTDRIIRQYEMDSSGLDSCTANMPTAIGTAWRIYDREKEPEHRRLDVGSGEWVGCYCGPA